MNLEKYAIIDLHLHLDGSLSPEAILFVADREGIKLPTTNKDELINLLQVPENCKSLNEYLERFDIPNLVLQTSFGLKECIIDLLKRLRKQGIRYAEIRMAPQLSTSKGLTQQEVVKSLIKGCKIARKFGIYSNLILCMMRGNNNKDKNLETIRVAKKFLGKGVVALDIAGAEGLFPNNLFEEEFNAAKKQNIPMTIHAGEAAGSESVKSAVLYGATRIGHGVHASEDKDTMNLLSKNNIVLEICPKSNLDTKTIKNYSELPFKHFIKNNVKFTINTDDMTVSNTTLRQEFKTLETLGFKEKEAHDIAQNAIEASFANRRIKHKLQRILEEIQ